MRPRPGPGDVNARVRGGDPGSGLTSRGRAEGHVHQKRGYIRGAQASIQDGVLAHDAMASDQNDLAGDSSGRAQRPGHPRATAPPCPWSGRAAREKQRHAVAPWAPPASPGPAARARAAQEWIVLPPSTQNVWPVR